jgi:hypothetical protein
LSRGEGGGGGACFNEIAAGDSFHGVGASSLQTMKAFKQEGLG